MKTVPIQLALCDAFQLWKYEHRCVAMTCGVSDTSLFLANRGVVFGTACRQLCVCIESGFLLFDCMSVLVKRKRVHLGLAETQLWSVQEVMFLAELFRGQQWC